MDLIPALKTKAEELKSSRSTKPKQQNKASKQKGATQLRTWLWWLHGHHSPLTRLVPWLPCGQDKTQRQGCGDRNLYWLLVTIGMLSYESLPGLGLG